MFSEETRHYLVRLVMHDLATVAFVARSLRVSTRSATSYLMYYRETGGAVHCDPAMWNRRCNNVRDDEQLRDAVLVAVEDHPEMLLYEMAAAVAQVAELVAPGVSASVSSVSRVLSHNGFTVKSIEKAFSTRDEAQRAAWVEFQWLGSCWLRRYISPQQYNVWPKTTIDGMLSHITGDMCAGFVRAAVRRYIPYVR
ncbi:hypothetical protein I4F81_003176 [Pyropia yezoensis]|uniref:Uncharacterized protein n=1 Tax=Pyropia yezoensis TaxID=2788 RepID=A0ACC3BRM3_PYRYE|nr:hypothetical protein I4F81_003176 [Neopyropia yezoensis]